MPGLLVAPFTLDNIKNIHQKLKDCLEYWNSLWQKWSSSGLIPKHQVLIQLIYSLL